MEGLSVNAESPTTHDPATGTMGAVASGISAGTAHSGTSAGASAEGYGEPLLSPYEAPDLYDLLFESFVFDMPYWLEVGKTAHGPVLDVACGTGRIMLRLLEAGVDVDGVDLYPLMLDQLRQKATARGLEARVSQGDMRDFTMPRRYVRAICGFNAFAHCQTTDDQIRALLCIREHLEPGGVLVLHMSYPSLAYWNDPNGEPVLELQSTHPVNGNTLQLWDTRFKNVVGQYQRSQMEVRELDAGGRCVDSQRLETTQRWVYRHELELLLRHAGFTRWDIRGGFLDEPLEHDDQQMIVWAWRD